MAIPPIGQAPIDESAPLGQNVWVLDYYTRSKVDCERLLWEMADGRSFRLTVIRPSWLFGERDRTTVPRLVREFRRGRMLIVGKGDNPLECGLRRSRGRRRHPGGARSRARGARRITSPARAGSPSASFSTCSPMRFEVPRVTRHVPYALAFAGGFSSRFRTGCS